MSKTIKVDKNLFRNAKKPVEMWESFKKMMEFFDSEMKRDWSDDEKVLCISNGNSKTNMPSYSTMPGFTCHRPDGSYPPCFTSGNCYALYNLRTPVVMENCVHNTVLILRYPMHFERELHKLFRENPSVRLHIEGDWVCKSELIIVDRVRKNNPNTKVLTYTKKYEMCNEYMKEYGVICGNFKLLYSKWNGLYMDNPFNMPECHVYETVREYEEAKDYRFCQKVEKVNGEYNVVKGNCAKCFFNNLLGNGKGGCFDMELGRATAMLAH